VQQLALVALPLQGHQQALKAEVVEEGWAAGDPKEVQGQVGGAAGGLVSMTMMMGCERDGISCESSNAYIRTSNAIQRHPFNGPNLKAWRCRKV
jgi:hypothetical protein